MIGISTQTLDDNGTLVLRDLPESQYQNLARRITSTKTLDGGVVIDDGGYADVDRAVEIVVASDADVYDRLKYFIENYSLVGLSSRIAFNTAAIKSIREANGKLTMICELAT
jgi:hypothetical protein